jgi:hypothetical protein
LNHFASTRYWKLFNALPDDIQAVARNKYELLKSNPRHPSLQFKRAGRYWSVRVNLSYRALAAENADGYVWFWIGPHDEYEQIIEGG